MQRARRLADWLPSSLSKTGTLGRFGNRQNQGESLPTHQEFPHEQALRGGSARRPSVRKGSS
jgi:hypothetical protein